LFSLVLVCLALFFADSNQPRNDRPAKTGGQFFARRFVRRTACLALAAVSVFALSLFPMSKNYYSQKRKAGKRESEKRGFAVCGAHGPTRWTLAITGHGLIFVGWTGKFWGPIIQPPGVPRGAQRSRGQICGFESDP
jgi:hypothetical protein